MGSETSSLEQGYYYRNEITWNNEIISSKYRNENEIQSDDENEIQNNTEMKQFHFLNGMGNEDFIFNKF